MYRLSGGSIKGKAKHVQENEMIGSDMSCFWTLVCLEITVYCSTNESNGTGWLQISGDRLHDRPTDKGLSDMIQRQTDPS